MSQSIPALGRNEGPIFGFLKGLSPSHQERITEGQLDKALPKLEGRVFYLARSLMQIFGDHYASAIAQRLDKKLYKAFEKLYDATGEMHDLFVRGVQIYSDQTFEKTTAVMIACRPKKQNAANFIATLWNHAYSMLPCPQTVRLYNDPTRFPGMQKTREAEVALLYQHLDAKIERPEEEKKEEGPQPHIALPAQEEQALTRLLFSGAAFSYWEKDVCKDVTFGQLLKFWGTLSLENAKKVAELLAKLPLQQWHPIDPLPHPEVFVAIRGELPFREFVAECSLENVQQSRGFRFTPFLRQYFLKEFQSEARRSEMTYFSAQQNALMLLSWDPKQHATLSSLQLLSFFVRTYGVSAEHQPELLTILLHRDPDWDSRSLEGFVQRKWCAKPILENEELLFTDAWKCLSKLVSAVDRKEGDPWLSVRCYNLLLLVLKKPNNFLGDLFFQLGQRRELSISFLHIFEFLGQNLSELTEKNRDLFVKSYHEVLDLLAPIQNGELLFLEPLLEWNQKTIDALGHARERAKTFLDEMRSYPCATKEELLPLLRGYLLKPVDFDWFKNDAPVLGIQKVDFPFVAEMLHAIPPSPGWEARACGQAVTQRIQNLYGLDDRQIFLIYLQTTLFHEKIFNRISALIHRLRQLNPYIPKKVIYFLFHYHPDTSMHFVDDWIEKREKLIHNKDEKPPLERFVLPRSLLDGLMDEIGKRAFLLAASCPREEEQAGFVASLYNVVREAFISPEQSVTEYLVGDVTKDGVSFLTYSHLGHVKFLGDSPFGVYLHWSLMDGYPTLFFTFTDLERGTAVSDFVSFGFRRHELDTEKKKEDYFNFLNALGLQVLKEIATEAHRANADDYTDTPAYWLSCYAGTKDMCELYYRNIVSEDHKNKTVLFLAELKKKYRRRYLEAISGLQSEELPYYDHKVPALGTLYPTESGGNLLPPHFVSSFYDNYAVKITDSMLDRCSVFKMRTEAPQPLGKEFDQTFVVGSRIRMQPVSYHVQTFKDVERRGDKDDLAETPEADLLSSLDLSESALAGLKKALKKKWHETAPPLKSVLGRYVFLSIEPYSISIPLKYPPEAFLDKKILKQYLRLHLAVLKMHFYKQLTVEEDKAHEHAGQP